MSRSRSLRFARRIALAIIGAPILEKPDGSPRFRSVIVVPPFTASDHVYVVSIGNGPSAVLITKRSPGTSSRTSYVYASVRPRKRATKASCEPTASGRGDFHSTAAMFSYQLVALSGSAA